MNCFPAGHGAGAGIDGYDGIGGYGGYAEGYDGLGGLFSFVGKALKGVVNIATTAAGVGPVFASGGGSGSGVTVTTQYTLADSIPYDFIDNNGVPYWRWPVGTGTTYATSAAMSTAIRAAIAAGAIKSGGPTSNPKVPNAAAAAVSPSAPAGSIPMSAAPGLSSVAGISPQLIAAGVGILVLVALYGGKRK